MTALLLLLAPTALAQDDAPVQTTGDLRTLVSGLSDFPVDAEGLTHGQTFWVDQRVRLGLDARAGVATIVTEWDLLTGQLAGDTWAIPGGVDDRGRDTYEALSLAGVMPRKLYAESVVGNTQVQAGLVTSHWGLGLLSNDGAHDPLFGRTDQGDRVVRLRATQLPHTTGATPRLQVLATGAFDLLVDDDIGSLEDGQSGFQGIGSLLWLKRTPGGGDPGRFGVYGVVRQQYEQPFWTAVDDPRATTVFVADAMVDLPWALGGSGWTLQTAAEVAAIAGRTDRANTYNAREALGVAQLGAAVHLTFTDPSRRTHLHLRGGIASGDRDPDDGVVQDFTFDPNFAAGMVLFDQVLGAAEAAAYNQLVDPGNAAVPPDGVAALVTEGAVKRAAFVQPVVQASPLPWAEVRAGVMIAFATAPYSQPFYTYRAGGSPTNFHDESADGRVLGTELDWALAARRDPADDATVRPTLEVQAGHLAPGPPLQGGDAPPWIHHVMGVARLQW